MNNFAIIEVNAETDKTTHSKLLSDIVSQLEAKGYDCKKGKGCACECYECTKDGNKVAIVMYVFAIIEENSKQTFLECENSFPWYKNLLFKISNQERFTGEALDEFVAQVKGIIDNDKRYVKCEWMNYDKWREVFK